MSMCGPISKTLVDHACSDGQWQIVFLFTLYFNTLRYDGLFQKQCFSTATLTKIAVQDLCHYGYNLTALVLDLKFGCYWKAPPVPCFIKEFCNSALPCCYVVASLLVGFEIWLLLESTSLVYIQCIESYCIQWIQCHTADKSVSSGYHIYLCISRSCV